MTYTLTLCLGLFLGLCGSQQTYIYPTKEECEVSRAQISAKTVGDGFAICAPTRK